MSTNSLAKSLGCRHFVWNIRLLGGLLLDHPGVDCLTWVNARRLHRCSFEKLDELMVARGLARGLSLAVCFRHISSLLLSSENGCIYVLCIYIKLCEKSEDDEQYRVDNCVEITALTKAIAGTRTLFRSNFDYYCSGRKRLM